MPNSQVWLSPLNIPGIYEQPFIFQAESIVFAYFHFKYLQWVVEQPRCLGARSPYGLRQLCLLVCGLLAHHVGGEVLLHGRAGAHQVLVPEGVVYPPHAENI